MNKNKFTMIELLVVIGILAILAGLLIPTVIGAKERGRIGQARADMSTLKTAFAGLEKDYGRMAYGSNHALGGHNFSESPGSSGCITIKDSLDNYCDVIAELSDPGNSAAGFSVSLNKRKIKYLDPRPEYDPSQSPTDTENKKHTWLDPWGNPYRIRINYDGSGKIPDPSGVKDNLSGSIVLWSLGPDGNGCSGTGSSWRTDDDKDNIPNWKDGNWLD